MKERSSKNYGLAERGRVNRFVEDLEQSEPPTLAMMREWTPLGKDGAVAQRSGGETELTVWR